MTDTSSLRAFIEARLAEDERLALAFLSERRAWEATGGYAETGPTQVRSGDILIIEDDSSWASEVVIHIARHDPARVLREVAAKRALLAQHQAVCDEVHQPLTAEHRMNARARQYQLEQVLPLLALPFADHPDYRTEWSTA